MLIVFANSIIYMIFVLFSLCFTEIGSKLCKLATRTKNTVGKFKHCYLKWLNAVKI